MKDQSFDVEVKDSLEIEDKEEVFEVLNFLVIEGGFMEVRNMNLFTVSNFQCSVILILAKSLLHLNHELSSPFLLLPFPVHEVSAEPPIQDIYCDKNNHHYSDHFNYAEPRF